MLEVRALSKYYGRHHALEAVDLHVARGEIVVMLGANGAGKSSLLKCVAGLQPCESGALITLDAVSIAGQAPHLIVEAGLALVPEGRGIFDGVRVDPASNPGNKFNGAGPFLQALNSQGAAGVEAQAE